MGKRWLSILLTLAMVTLMVTGCQNQAQSSSQSSPPSTNGNNSESASVDSEAAFLQKEPIDVSFAYWNVVDHKGNEVGERIYKRIQDQFRINWVNIPVTWADATQKLSMLAASDDLPDVLVIGGWDDKVTFKKYVDEGLIRDIPKEMYSKYPDLNRIMEKYNYETMPDGKLYQLPRDDYSNSNAGGNPTGLFYRTDYAANLGYTGLEKPMTIDGFTKFLYDMANKDPDKNGKKDTYGITNGVAVGIGYFREVLYPMFGYRPWVYEDGGWKVGFASTPAKEATRWLNQLYRDGVLDPEFAITSETGCREKLCTGLVGTTMYPMNATNARIFRTSQWEAINPSMPIEDYVGFLPLPSMNDGMFNSAPKTYWSGTAVSSRVDDEKLDRILRLFDWLYSEDGYEYTTYGEENIDFEIKDKVYTTLRKDAKGEPQLFRNAGTFLMLGSMAAWHLDGIEGAIDPLLTNWDMASEKVLHEQYWKYNWSNEMNFPKYMFTPEVSKYDFNVFENELVNLIMKSTDFDADWQKYVDKMYKEYRMKGMEDEVNEYATKNNTTWEPYQK